MAFQVYREVSQIHIVAEAKSNEDLHLCSPSTSVRWTKTAESTP